MKTNNPLKYSNCWEDSELLLRGLQPDGNSRIMSVASAGDNSLMLLTSLPLTMLCVDTSNVQLWVTQFKEQAIKHLSYLDFLKITGFIACHNRKTIYENIKPFLSPEADAFINDLLSGEGLIHQGKFEKYFRVFAHKIVPFIHNQKKVKALFIQKSEAQQIEFYTSKWNTFVWRFFFRLFFSRFILGKFGREPEKLKEVSGSVAKTIYNMAEKHLTSVHCQSNYFLRYALTGEFADMLPPYARKVHFDKIKYWLQHNRIQYFNGTLSDALNSHHTYNRFNLSNIFEYMTVAEFAKQAALLQTNSAAHSRFCYWNLLVDRKLEDNTTFIREEIELKDYGFFYKAFITNIKNG